MRWLIPGLTVAGFGVAVVFHNAVLADLLLIAAMLFALLYLVVRFVVWATRHG